MLHIFLLRERFIPPHIHLGEITDTQCFEWRSRRSLIGPKFCLWNFEPANQILYQPMMVTAATTVSLQDVCRFDEILTGKIKKF